MKCAPSSATMPVMATPRLSSLRNIAWRGSHLSTSAPAGR
jgi:hypothetical protein